MPGLHCPWPDRLGDSGQALPAMRHRGELARLVSHFPVTHYKKLRRHANDFSQFVSIYRAKHVAAQETCETTLRPCSRPKIIGKRSSGAGVCILASTACIFLIWVGASTWSSFLARRRGGTKASSMAMDGDEPCQMEARLLGKEYGGFLRRPCVSAIDFRAFLFVLDHYYLY